MTSATARLTGELRVWGNGVRISKQIQLFEDF